MQKRFSAKDEAFWRKRVLSEEDYIRLGTRARGEWKGGYRWFRSENIVCLEHYRAAEPNSSPRMKAS
jgi:hypothetical protein